jgi:ABC-type polysaccharide/polyol phosphate export permease
MFLSLTLEGLAIYTIQLLFIVFMLLFYAFEGHEVVITISAILLSLLPIVYISVLSLFLGITFSSLTIKYRDLNHFLTYIMQILFFTSPVLFSNSVIEKKIEWIFHLNPLYYHLCFYRSIFLKNSVMPNISFLYSSLIILAIFFVISKYAYKHAEKTFDDFV